MLASRRALVRLGVGEVERIGRDQVRVVLDPLRSSNSIRSRSVALMRK